MSLNSHYQIKYHSQALSRGRCSSGKGGQSCSSYCWWQELFPLLSGMDRILRMARNNQEKKKPRTQTRRKHEEKERYGNKDKAMLAEL